LAYGFSFPKSVSLRKPRQAGHSRTPTSRLSTTPSSLPSCLRASQLLSFIGRQFKTLEGRPFVVSMRFPPSTSLIRRVRDSGLEFRYAGKAKQSKGFCILRRWKKTAEGWESIIALWFRRIHLADFPQPGRGHVLDESGTTSDRGRPNSNFRHAFCRDAFSWSRHGNPGRMASWTLQTLTGGWADISLPHNNTLRSPNTEDQEILDDLF
jgi:hypothetical protein